MEVHELTPEWINAVLAEIRAALGGEKVVYYESEYRPNGVAKFVISIYPPEVIVFSNPQEDGAK